MVSRWSAGFLVFLLASLLPTASGSAEAEALNGYFLPGELAVALGERVVWTNGDDRPHTVTSSWDDGGTFDRHLAPGESFTWRFDAPGAYPIHCAPHASKGEDGAYAGMVMTVLVDAPAAFQGEAGDDAREAPGLVVAGVTAVVGTLAVATRGLLRRG